jgi:hypothetical protein
VNEAPSGIILAGRMSILLELWFRADDFTRTTPAANDQKIVLIGKVCASRRGDRGRVRGKKTRSVVRSRDGATAGSAEPAV